MEFGTLFGIIAGIVLIIAYIPQIRKTYRLKKTDEISLGLFAMVGIGIAMWVGYGLYIRDYIVFTMNLLLLGFNLTVVAMKIIYDRKSS